MDACLTLVLWSFVFLLTGSDGPTIIYPFPSTCAVRGSTVTLPCSFTPLKSITKDGRNVPLEIIKVVWCPNHEICQLTTPTVYNSSGTNDPRYQYLGDMRSNCTLQIRDIQKKDNAVFRFRMEANDPAGHFTNRTGGVKVQVADGDKMSINSSRCDRALRGGDTVTLSCSGSCTFHPLEVAWFKDGHALSESGPALHLGSLTAGDSGNYSCALRNYTQSLSAAYSLQVEAGADPGSDLPLIVGVACGVALAAVTLALLVIVIVKRSRAAGGQRSEGNVSSPKPDGGSGGEPEEEPGRSAEDVSYAAVQFKHKKQDRYVEEVEDAVIYSAVVGRG